MCQLTDYDSKVKRTFKLDNSTYDICLSSNFVNNLTVTNRGKLKVRLGKLFQPPPNFERLVETNSSELHKIVKLKVATKK